MSFNKTKSMRNAERYLTNGRIEAAIGEYRQIVEHDRDDITTQNMLGDLYVKAMKTDQAVACYRKVAEHYNKQGFAKKAIAVYNKIYKLVPDSTEVVGKLGELYHLRGSVAEARAHYKIFAERLESEGKSSEVLDVWYKLADLDSKDPSICLKIAETQRERNHKDEACKAYFEAGTRLAEKGEHAEAVSAFQSALDVNGRFGKAVRGLVRAHILLGTPADAAALLEERLEADQYNKELIFLLIDCYFEMKDPAAAERVITKLVEREPANYPKLLDLVKVYLQIEDPDSAVRILSMTSEHLLAGGDAKTLERHLERLLEADPQNIDGLRMLARCYGWQREQQKLKETLGAMGDAANEAGRHADERWALSQYLIYVPHDSERADRFRELVESHGPLDDSEEELLAAPDDEHDSQTGEEFGLESEAEFAAVNGDGSGLVTHLEKGSEEVVAGTVVEESGYVTVSGEQVTVLENGATGAGSLNGSSAEEFVKTPLSPTDEVRLDEEVVSIRFYIEQGYTGLADKALSALEQEFGRRKELVELRAEFGEADAAANDLSTYEAHPAPQSHSSNGSEPASYESQASVNYEVAAEHCAEESMPADPISEIATDLGLNEPQKADPEEFEDHYNRGVVYREMGMIEEAIREFQDAAECAGEDDRSGNYYNTCTMLGHCFLEQGMPKLALIWFSRAYEMCDLSADEKQALEYELGNIYEMSDEPELAIEHFEKVYAVDVDYRDVAGRLETLRASHPVAG